MATVVVDCSVVAKWLLPEPDRDAAMVWLDRWAAGDVDLIAPDLLLAEFASLLAKRVRRKQISPEQAREGERLLAKASPRLHEMRPLLPTALDLALQHYLSLWDCVYLALAAGHDCPFVTADKRLLRARHPRIRHMKAAMPS